MYSQIKQQMHMASPNPNHKLNPTLAHNPTVTSLT